MNENHQIQDSLSYSGEQNNKLIEAALSGGSLAAKLAGAGGGGTIIDLTLEAEKTKKVLLEAGAEMVLGLDDEAEGITIEEIEDNREEVAAAEE